MMIHHANLASSMYVPSASTVQLLCAGSEFVETMGSEFGPAQGLWAISLVEECLDRLH